MLGHLRNQVKAGQPVTGRIVNTTSGAGLFGNIGQLNYGPAKAAIASSTMVTAMEMEALRRDGQRHLPVGRHLDDRGLPGMTADSDETGIASTERTPRRWSPTCARRRPVVEAAPWCRPRDTVQRLHPWDIDAERTYQGNPGEAVYADQTLDHGARRFPRLSERPALGRDRVLRRWMFHAYVVGPHVVGDARLVARAGTEPAVLTETTTWSGQELLERAVGAADHLGRSPAGSGRCRRL